MKRFESDRRWRILANGNFYVAISFSFGNFTESWDGDYKN